MCESELEMAPPHDIFQHVHEVVCQRNARQHGPEHHPAEQNDQQDARVIDGRLRIVLFIVEKVVAEEFDEGIGPGRFRFRGRGVVHEPGKSCICKMGGNRLN